jgi:hypothetical protein
MKTEISYTIYDHRHRFCAWAASRAASVKGCRFTVWDGRQILEDARFNEILQKPTDLPSIKEVDERHREWRLDVLKFAKARGFCFSHGVAAKLINVYLKATFVCGGHHHDPKVRALHPPIDALLLKNLEFENIGGFEAHWKKARKLGWSKLNSEQYEDVIAKIREVYAEDLWSVEYHWPGCQSDKD